MGAQEDLLIFELRETSPLAIIQKQINRDAAALGCAVCAGPVKRDPFISPSTGEKFDRAPAGPPFRRGPYQGRYWCMDCWTVYWSEHPECVADARSIALFKEDAERIKLARLMNPSAKSEVLFSEGESRAVLTSRGTIALDIKKTEGQLEGEYSPERFAVLERALKAIREKRLDGYSLG